MNQYAWVFGMLTLLNTQPWDIWRQYMTEPLLHFSPSLKTIHTMVELYGQTVGKHITIFNCYKLYRITTVNHSLGFVDSQTKVHTNHIKNYWNHVKKNERFAEILYRHAQKPNYKNFRDVFSFATTNNIVQCHAFTKP